MKVASPRARGRTRKQRQRWLRDIIEPFVWGLREPAIPQTVLALIGMLHIERADAGCDPAREEKDMTAARHAPKDPEEPEWTRIRRTTLE